MLGRVRGAWLVSVITMKLAFFIIMLISWCGMGSAWSYEYNPSAYVQSGSNQSGYTRVGPTFLPIRINWPVMIAFAILGGSFGMVGRMLLLRWRRGTIIGLILAALALAAAALGARMRIVGLSEDLPSPFQRDFLTLLAIGAGAIILGAAPRLRSSSGRASAETSLDSDCCQASSALPVLVGKRARTSRTHKGQTSAAPRMIAPAPMASSVRKSR